MPEDKSLATVLTSTLLTGAIGAGLIYYSRRNQGLIAGISATVGYSLLTKAVSGTILAALDQPRS